MAFKVAFGVGMIAVLALLITAGFYLAEPLRGVAILMAAGSVLGAVGFMVQALDDRKPGSAAMVGGAVVLLLIVGGGLTLIFSHPTNHAQENDAEYCAAPVVC